MTTYKLDENVSWLNKFKGHYGQPVYVATHDLSSSGGNVYQAFSIVRELRSFDDGVTLGYIVIDVDPKFISEILSKVKLDAKELLYITDDSGKLVIGKDHGLPQAAPSLSPDNASEGVRHVKSEGKGC